MIYLTFNGLEFRVDHDDIIGWQVYQDSTEFKLDTWVAGLMRRDGSLVPRSAWSSFGVEQNRCLWHDYRWEKVK